MYWRRTIPILNSSALRIIKRSKPNHLLMLNKNCRRTFSDNQDPKKPDIKKLIESLKAEINQSSEKLKEMHEKLSPYVYLIGVGGLLALIYLFMKKGHYIASIEELDEDIRAGNVYKIEIIHSVSGDRIIKSHFVVKTNSSTYIIEMSNPRHMYDKLLTIRQIDQNIMIEDKYYQTAPATLYSMVHFISSFAMVAIFFIFMSKGANKSAGNSMNLRQQDFTKSTAKKFSKDTKIKIRFGDVAGMDEAKKEIEEFVDFLKRPKKYKDLGAKLPSGALLSGPPGTGKTLLAKACAGEAGVPFFFVSGSEFVEMFVGVGASRVRDLFKQAKDCSPAIIFIDEIDAIGKKRSARLSNNSEADSTLNQLLVEMDGFGTDSNVIIFAATNRKELLDPALTRPGRFDRSIDVILPDIDGRRDIFKVHLMPLKLKGPEDLEKHARRLASLTPGFSGADIANICNEAAIQAVRNQHKHVTTQDFEMAVERVVGGLEKKRKDNADERRVVAVHESGHGVVSWYLEGASPLLKLTIIPRSKGALGFAQYLPSEQSLQTKQELEDQIIAILGGRCAELEFFGEVTTGAYDDLQKAYRLAHSIVTKLGMSEKIGNLSLQENDFGIKGYSDSMNREIDQECHRIIDECTLKCKNMIKTHRDKIEKLSNILLEKETIDLKIITEILGPRPFEAKRSFKAYLEESIND